MVKLQDILSELPNKLKQYKYALLVLFIGICILLLPKNGQKKESLEIPNEKTELSFEEYGQEVEKRLEEVLSQIDGVGAVDVILTMKQGSTKHYLNDSNITKENRAEGTSVTEERNTVIFSKGSAYDEATVTTVDYPLFQGALIVCQGGGRPEIQLLLTQAVSALTNLRSDKITVVKMK